MKDLPLAELRRAYESGMTLLALASSYNCTAQTISNKLKQAGAKLRKRGHVAGTPAPWNTLIKLKKEQIPEILRQFDNGIATKKIAAQFGVSPQRIHQVAKASGRTRKKKNGSALGKKHAKEAKNLAS